MAIEKTYDALWRENLEILRLQIKNSVKGVRKISLNKSDFIAAGTRKDYSFTIIINKCKLENYPTGSVVGDNLYELLTHDIKAKELLANRNIKIKMDGNFVVSIEGNS